MRSLRGISELIDQFYPSGENSPGQLGQSRELLGSAEVSSFAGVKLPQQVTLLSHLS